MLVKLPSPERKKRLQKIQDHLKTHKENGGVTPLAEAVALMLEEPDFQRHVAASPQLKGPYDNEGALMDLVWAYLYHLLYANELVAAAMILWDEETFTAEPRCVQLVWNAIMHNRMICIIGAGGVGKCLGPNVAVLMFDGSMKPAKAVVVGDVLMGDDGTPRNVLQINPGSGPMYRITPERGEPWTCNGDHILTLRCGYGKKCGSGKMSSTRVKGSVIDVPLNEYLTWSSSKKEHYHLFHVGVDFPEKPLPFDPYIYGAWLGDGHFDAPAVSKPDGPMIREWVRYFESLPGFRISSCYHDKCPTWFARFGEIGTRCASNPFTDFIRTSRKDGTKIILDDYLRNSRKNRMALLAGLLDSDGCSLGRNFEFCAKNEHFARQVAWLARSLGFACTVKPMTKGIKSTGFVGHYWRLHISGRGISSIPTLQKHALEPITNKDLTNTGFSVERIEDGPYNGFVIDGNRRFLLGDFTVTHNTYSSCAYILLQWILDPEWTKIQVASASKDHLEKNALADIFRLYEGASIALPGKADAGSISLSKKRAQGIFSLIIPSGSDGKAKLKGSHTKARPPHPIFGRRSRVYCLVDEGQEVAQNIFGQIANRFSTVDGDDVDHLKFILTANPKDIFSEFGKCAKPKGGFDTISRADDTWRSAEGWAVVSIDAMKHENVIQKRSVFPGFVTWAGVQNWLNKCQGNWEDPQMYTYVYGKFPPMGLSSSVIKQNHLTRSEGEWIFDSMTEGKAGSDPAFVGDRPAFAAGRSGRAIGWIDYEGKKHMLDKPRMAIQVDAVTVLPRGDSQDLADHNMSRLKELSVQPNGFGIDMTGAGRGTHDIIRRQWPDKVGPLTDGQLIATIQGIEFGAAPSTFKVAEEDTATPKDEFNIMASELWFVAAKLFEMDVIRIGKGVELSVFAELAARCGGMQAGLGTKRAVESKGDFKRRTGMRSPDLADATLIMIHVARITTPGLVVKAKDTAPLPAPTLVAAWSGFNQGFGAADFDGFGGNGEMADMVKD